MDPRESSPWLERDRRGESAALAEIFARAAACRRLFARALTALTAAMGEEARDPV